jgi:hypothetical protein
MKDPNIIGSNQGNPDREGGIPAHVHEPEGDVPRSLLRPLRRLWVDVWFRLNTRWAAFGFRGGVHIERDRDNR